MELSPTGEFWKTARYTLKSSFPPRGEEAGVFLTNLHHCLRTVAQDVDSGFPNFPCTRANCALHAVSPRYSLQADFARVEVRAKRLWVGC